MESILVSIPTKVGIQSGLWILTTVTSLFYKELLLEKVKQSKSNAPMKVKS